MDLPKIACFHGGGSNSRIYDFQCEQLAHLLRFNFQFVFFDGPFESGPGPGVLPVFRDYNPYFSWRPHDAGLSGRNGYDGIQRVWKLMEQDPTPGQWVGVMGFSQGTMVAGGLLLDQQRRERLGLGRPEGTTSDIRLQFGVMCMGAGEPMQSQDAGEELVTMPTLHVHGLKDVFLSLGQQQYANYYADGSKRLYEVDYHHAMPFVRREVERLAELIRELYRESYNRAS